MNNNDFSVESKQAAQSLIEAMDGLTVGVALDALTRLELICARPMVFVPEEMQRYHTILRQLDPRTCHSACVLAAFMIRERTIVNTEHHYLQQVFTVWESEAAISNAWKNAR